MEELSAQTVYFNGPFSIYFDGYDTFTVYDTILRVDEFNRMDIVTMEDAIEAAHRYVKDIGYR